MSPAPTQDIPQSLIGPHGTPNMGSVSAVDIHKHEIDMTDPHSLLAQLENSTHYKTSVKDVVMTKTNRLMSQIDQVL